MKAYWRELFAFFFCGINAFSMMNTDDLGDFSVDCPITIVNSTVNSALLNFSAQKSRLVDIDFLNGTIPMSQFLESNIKFHEVLTEHAQGYFSHDDNQVHMLMVDFDGVLGRKLLVQKQNNDEYPFVLDAQNCSLQPNYKLPLTMNLFHRI